MVSLAEMEFLLETYGNKTYVTKKIKSHTNTFNAGTIDNQKI